MTILETHTASLPSKLFALPYTVLARTGAFIADVSDVLSEALEQADKARRRYPFCDW